MRPANDRESPESAKFVHSSLGERLFDLLVRSTTEHAIIALDPEWRVRFWNAGATQILGYGAGEMDGQSLDRIFTPEDRAAAMVDQEFSQATSIGRCEDERWQVRKDGSRFWALGVMIPLRDVATGELIGYGKVLSDHTDSKQYWESLQNRADELASSDHRKTVFLATLAHELRGALSPMQMSVEIVRLTEQQPGSRARTAAEVMDRQVKRMRRLVDDLLDLSRLHWNKLRLEPREVRLQDVVDQAVEAVCPLVKSRHQDLDVVVPEPPIVVSGDQDRLIQVALNLLTNASKFTPVGGALGITASVEGENAVMRVFDSGMGLSPEDIERIFQLFTQVSTSEKTSDPGLGIGLALVQQLVNLHGGHVAAMSEGRGKGSVFVVRLPLAHPGTRDAP
ncbi:MAG TPA: PAS domain-containing sensor histidine kinase [Xanthomonadales bacterium]|nr:PAS domain-containing sensor histidine kinase [Xanthomonadales bacterium]